MDPVAIATLAGPTLGAVVQFLCTKLGGALERRDAVVSEGETRFVLGYEGPISPNEAAYTVDRITSLKSTADVLDVYREHPEIIKPKDARLAAAIVSACEGLREIYGLNIRLAETGSDGVKLTQELGDVERPITGVRASEIRKGANLDVRQSAVRVRGKGSLIGLEIEGGIG
ncbi:hypothetical protein GCM10011608_02440 [Micromonospora sonchi]|uniref:Uncharacterized protein n=1 Tax=Micromonospora sonchi TaxID=1763543 RepID=A0A917TF44_9ACTN|nr:hypothetical protein [Micromonospora sonchi]GGM21291.1 hypothetical protein GCM10011608_02440 [Micromonospora sonchi]